MIPIYDLAELTEEQILSRDIQAEEDVADAVDVILADVRDRGDAALRDYARRFDGAELTELQVGGEELADAWASLDEDFLETLRQAAENIRRFHERQVPQGFVLADRPGIVMGQRYTPIEKVGICVPRSPVAFPSTVLMNVIPAKLAGVEEIVPPGSSSAAAPRRWPPWLTARSPSPGWTRSWAPAASTWPRPSARFSVGWTST